MNPILAARGAFLPSLTSSQADQHAGKDTEALTR